MLVLIGPRWFATTAEGHGRLFDPKDFVRIEIEIALRRDVRVILLLFDEARMPAAEEMPESIRALAVRKSVEISHKRFDANVRMLVQALRRIVTPPHGNSSDATSNVGNIVLKEAPKGDTLLLALPDRRSIAVMPFTNISGDVEQEYFADGIIEDVITEISRIPQLLVIARNSTFTYKGKATKVQDVCRDLNVRYLLEGSVRRSGQQVRVTAQLIDGVSGAHVWAERHDRELADIFAVQDGITAQIVRALEIKLLDASRALSAHTSTNNPEAYDCVSSNSFLTEAASKLIFWLTGCVRRACLRNPVWVRSKWFTGCSLTRSLELRME